MYDVFDFDMLEENVQDWFYTNCHRTCYDCDNEYIDDIRSMIANDNDDMVDTCIEDLVDVYYMDEDEVAGHKEDIIELLVKSAQDALDNFSYSYSDDDDE